MVAQQTPAACVTNATPAAGDASDATRGVTLVVTRNAVVVTRNGVTQSLASPVLQRHDAAGTFQVTRVTRNAGTPYPLNCEKGARTPRRGAPERGPAARVTVVTTLGQTQDEAKRNTSSAGLAREGSAQ